MIRQNPLRKLKTPFLSLSHEEQQNLVIERRNSRMQAKTKKKLNKKKETDDTMAELELILMSLPADEREEFLASLSEEEE